MKTKEIFMDGLLHNNPTLVQLIGLCSVLAVSVTTFGAIGMGISLLVVLTASNVVISLMRNFIPDDIRIPSFIVVIASFVTILEMVLHAFVPELYNLLGIFLPLIVVNCIILGRAEMFASKNGILDSTLDGIGMGIGYTIVLVIMGMFREFFGSGSLFDIPILAGKIEGVGILNLAPGGFFTFAILVALVNYITRDKSVKHRDFGEEDMAIIADAKAVAEKTEEKGA